MRGKYGSCRFLSIVDSRRHLAPLDFAKRPILHFSITGHFSLRREAKNYEIFHRFSIKPFASGFLHVPLFLVHSSVVKLILLLDGLITINFDVAKAEKDRSPVRDLITEIRPGDNHRSQNIPRMIANYRYGECIVPDPDRRRRVSTTSLISP